MTMGDVVNIRAAKIQKNKPLVTMGKRELEETFAFTDRSIYAGMLADARSGANRELSVVGLVLSVPGGQDRLILAYEEYGDEENVELCDELADEYARVLHRGETIRRATFDVDLTRVRAVTIPPERLLSANEQRLRRRRMTLEDVRGGVTLVVIWLVRPGRKDIFTWDVDHGDNSALIEHTRPTIKAVKMNRILGRDERLSVRVYHAPMGALRERR